MTSLRDQFSAVRKAQFEAQFDFFNSVTTQAFESASRVAALNVAVSRDAVQRSIGATFALMNSRDPRDVLKLGGQAEEQVRSLFDYGRELLGIASGIRPYAVRPQALALAAQPAIESTQAFVRDAAETVAKAAPVAAVPVAAAAAVVEAAPAAAPAPAAVAAPEASAEPVVVAEPEPAPEPLAAVAEPEPVPVAEPKVIAKAVAKGTARAAAVPHPAAAPLPPSDSAEAPKIETPPVASRRKK